MLNSKLFSVARRSVWLMLTLLTYFLLQEVTNLLCLKTGKFLEHPAMKRFGKPIAITSFLIINGNQMNLSYCTCVIMSLGDVNHF